MQGTFENIDVNFISFNVLMGVGSGEGPRVKVLHLREKSYLGGAFYHVKRGYTTPAYLSLRARQVLVICLRVETDYWQLQVHGL